MNKYYENFYDDIAKSRGKDDDISGIDEYRMDLFLDMIKDYKKTKKKQNISILDVGPRNAWLKKFIDSYDLEINYVCIDISQYYVDLMKKEGINAYQGDIIKKTSFNDRTFDIIVMGEILEHIPDTYSALEECKRILKTDGIIIGSVPNVWNVGNMIRIFLRKDTDSSGEHIHYFDKYHIRNLFKLLDFKIIRIWSGPFSYSLSKFYRINNFMADLTNTGTNVFFNIKK